MDVFQCESGEAAQLILEKVGIRRQISDAAQGRLFRR
jgi:hypothetical protein